MQALQGVREVLQTVVPEQSLVEEQAPTQFGGQLATKRKNQSDDNCLKGQRGPFSFNADFFLALEILKLVLCLSCIYYTW